MIEVYKASAGSGKTEKLTKQYLSLLSEGDEDKYKHILAVTFTNAATDEMKDRVLRSLYTQSLENTETGIKARKVLIRLLHDYSSFSITTIDRFFQSVVRSFAREVGQYASYRVELDDKSVLSMAIDNMMDSLDEPENKKVLEWLVRYSVEQLELDGNHDIEKKLISMSALFLKEDFRLRKIEASKEGRFITDRNEIDRLAGDLRKKAIDFESKLKELAISAIKIVDDCGLAYNDFYQTNKSGIVAVSRFAKISVGGKNDIALPNSYFYVLLEGPDYWFSKKDAARFAAQRVAAERAGLQDYLQRIADHLESGLKEYNTVKLVLANINIFGLFTEIYNNIYSILRERNLALLSESSEIIHDIIDGSDVPFIYEKIGNRYENLMIDEFQDTSIMQWDNFKPLVSGSLATGNYNMVVGDVKQSIYRWRGSDWNTLDSGIVGDFRNDQIVFPPMNTNFRSGKEIVKFNNDFFSHIGEYLGESKVSAIYADVSQEAQKEFEGHILVNFVKGASKNEWMVAALEQLKGEIERLHVRLGYPLSSIAVLTRTRKEARDVADNLISLGFNVISEDSLAVSASATVKKISAILVSLAMSDNMQNKLLLKQMDLDEEVIRNVVSECKENSLYNLAEELIRKFCGDVPSGEIVYVEAFLDFVLDYQNNNGSDLTGFVKWWLETGFTQSVSMPADADAVKVFTIHKSKGLEMDAVIIPFFGFRLNHSGMETVYLWCKPPVDFSELGLIPLKYSKQLESTFFSEEYAVETQNTIIDAVNTAYVACTRAKSELVIFAPAERDKRASSVADALRQHIAGDAEGSYRWEFGTEIDFLTYKSAVKGRGSDLFAPPKQTKMLRLESVPVHGTDGRLKLAYQAKDYFDEGSKRIKGIVLHDIMSSIKTKNDLPAAVREVVREGKLSDNDSAEVLRMLGAMIDSHPGWFGIDVEILNEMPIIKGDGNVDRPDRIVISDGEVSIIDYKFGEEEKSYRYQLLRYMNALRQMGYENVNGYIWYGYENKVEKI